MQKERMDLNNKEDSQKMSLKLKKIFSYDGIYNQATKNSQIQKYIDELKEINQKSEYSVRVVSDEN